MTELERDLERYFYAAVLRAGGRAFKLTGTKGIPDRLVLAPGGRVLLVELKTETGRREPAQRALALKALLQQEVAVSVLYGRPDVDSWVAHDFGRETPAGARPWHVDRATPQTR